MILITGACGLIGSKLVQKLNEQGREDLVLMDLLTAGTPHNALYGKRFADFVDVSDSDPLNLELPLKGEFLFDTVIHLGANVISPGTDFATYYQANTKFSKDLVTFCLQNVSRYYQNLHFIYASTSATYGTAALPWSDDHDLIGSLKPASPYALSKHIFDMRMLQLNKSMDSLFNWHGLKLSNVFGAWEHHKITETKKYASMPYQIARAFLDFGTTPAITKPKFQIFGRDGKACARDITYVDDVVNAILFFIEKKPESGIYNVSPCKAVAYDEIAAQLHQLICPELDYQPEIEEIPMQKLASFQMKSQQDITKLKNAGFAYFTSIETALRELVADMELYKQENGGWN